MGPFSCAREFHVQNFNTAYPTYTSEPDERTKLLIAQRKDKKFRIVLTHGDLLPHNILSDDDGRPIGIVDWEAAAWLPEHWEMTRSLYLYAGFHKVWKKFGGRCFLNTKTI